MKSMLYSYWGFTGDARPISSPDGGATYCWPMLKAFQDRSWHTYWTYQDRDAEMHARLGDSLFGGPCAKMRQEVYAKTIQTGGVDLPDVDLVVHEWRWVIPGYPQDEYLNRQKQVLEHYLRPGSKTTVVIYDGDQKLTAADELRYPGAIIAEPSLRPHFLTRQRISLMFCAHPLLLASGQGHVLDVETMIDHDLAYVGNRYERDEDMTTWLKPASEANLKVNVFGKWEPKEDLVANWPRVKFHGRIDAGKFTTVMSRSVAVPLLAKPNYHESGHITLRAAEALAAGSIPIALGTFTGANVMAPRVAKDPVDLINHVRELSKQSFNERRIEHMTAVQHVLKWCDPARFYDTLVGTMESVLRPVG